MQFSSLSFSTFHFAPRHPLFLRSSQQLIALYSSLPETHIRHMLVHLIPVFYRFINFTPLSSSFFLIFPATVFLDLTKCVVSLLNVPAYFLLSKQNSRCGVLYKENKLILLAVWKTKGAASGGLIHLSSAEGFVADDITMATVCTKRHIIRRKTLRTRA